MIELNIYFEKSNPCLSNPLFIYERFFELIKNARKNINFNYIDSRSLRTPENYLGPNTIYGSHFMRIENPMTKKFLLISYWDKARNIFEKESGFDVPNLLELYTSIGIHGESDITYDLCDPPIKYTPISYCHETPAWDQYVEENFQKQIIKKIPEKPRIRAFPYVFREYLLKEKRFNYIDARYERLHQKEYCEELNEDFINIAPNAKGEISYREIGILGLGNVMLRTKHRVQFKDPLIPEYHYSSVEIDDFSNYEKLADAFLDKYNKIKNDKEYLNFISKNAREWYLNNGTSEKNAQILFQTVDINKLLK
jgi:hypothetical protein